MRWLPKRGRRVFHSGISAPAGPGAAARSSLVVAGRYDHSTETRALAVLFAAAGVMALVSLAVPHGPGIDVALSLPTACAAFPVAGALAAFGG